MTAFVPVEDRKGIGRDDVVAAVAGRDTPVIFRGAVADWTLVRQPSVDALIDYLKGFDAGKSAEVFRQSAGGDGRFFYDESGRGFNFERGGVPMGGALEQLRALAKGAAEERIYIQSAPLKLHFPGLNEANDLKGVAAEPRVWIGNRSITQTHFDLEDNLVCMVAGSKRFILFPPEQTKNLYVGPFDTTISGVPTAMVNLEDPDFVAHRRFREALATATVADLEPGDVLFIPYMWWHHVVSDGDFNVQINYWWDPAPAAMGPPMQVLIHAMLSLRELPSNQNAAWKAMFDHFVFHQSDPVAAHLLPEVRGIQGDLTPDQRTAIRRQLGRNMQD